MDSEDNWVSPWQRSWKQPGWKKFIFFCESGDRLVADGLDGTSDRATLCVAITEIGDLV